MKRLTYTLLFLMALLIASSCSTLTKTQRMERDMFDPKPTRAEKKVIKQEGVKLPKNKVKMPKRRKR